MIPNHILRGRRCFPRPLPRIRIFARRRIPTAGIFPPPKNKWVFTNAKTHLLDMCRFPELYFPRAERFGFERKPPTSRRFRGGFTIAVWDLSPGGNFACLGGIVGLFNSTRRRKIIDRIGCGDLLNLPYCLILYRYGRK